MIMTILTTPLCKVILESENSEVSTRTGVSSQRSDNTEEHDGHDIDDHGSLDEGTSNGGYDEEEDEEEEAEEVEEET